LKRPKSLVFLTFLCLSLSPVASAQDTYRELSQLPWNGDWLAEQLDQFVHGEDYYGYPGPLPKLMFALGLDIEHPAVDFELLERVRRDAPYWFGTCNGWAAAAVSHPEPQPMVINGVKFFGGETKAILSYVWKDNVEIPLGSTDFNGLTAQSFENLLNEFIGQDQPMVFDVSLGEESWNFPVAAFRRDETRSGNVVDVETTIYYTDTLELLDVESWLGESLFRPIVYTYRITELEGGGKRYEWTGSSIDDRPDRAWYPTEPYLPGVWFKNANRFFNLNLYRQMTAMSQSADAVRDLYEPNDSVIDAAGLPGRLALASLPPGDVDWLRIEAGAGEGAALAFEVYDGPGVTLTLYAQDGETLAVFENAKTAELTLPENFAGAARLKIERSGQSDAASFYKIERNRNYSWYRAPETLGERTRRVAAVNLGDAPAALFGGEAAEAPAGGMAPARAIAGGARWRTTTETIWAVEETTGDKALKRYHWRHATRMPAVVPHLTFRNGWRTHLMVDADSAEALAVRVFDQEGAVVQATTLPAEALGRLIDLGPYLSENARVRGAWLRLEGGALNRLSGYVRYAHDSGVFADRDLSASPRNGEQYLFGFDGLGRDWVGLSLVNVSGVENEVLYRLYNDRQQAIEEGSMILAPDARWLGVPDSLFEAEIEANFHVRFFSQFDLESLVIRRNFDKNAMYAHALMEPTLDLIDEKKQAYVTVTSGDPAQQELLFANLSLSSSWVTMEAFDAAGASLGLYRVGNQSIRGLRQACIAMEEALSDEAFQGVSDQIAYFAVTASRPVFAYELMSAADNPNKTHAAIPLRFEDP